VISRVCAYPIKSVEINQLVYLGKEKTMSAIDVFFLCMAGILGMGDVVSW